jgi:PKD repeat protein
MKTKIQFILPLLICIVWGWTGNMQAQTPVLPDKCGTMYADSVLRASNSRLGSLTDFEKDLQGKIIELRNKQKSGRTTAQIITIPIIVHVIHNGEAVGQGANISAAQVQSQLTVLNEDFRRKNADAVNTAAAFKSVAADIEIEFCLAKLDRSGKVMAEPGIDRYNGRKTSWTSSEIDANLKPFTVWDPDKYFNIWVVNDVSSGTAKLAGYAQFPIQSNLEGIPPGATGASTDGVVIWNKAFGKGASFDLASGTDKGRTLTHETGHWLGLRHIWGDGDCADDFSADTPPQASESRGCQVGRVSCGNVNMVQNYMDYSNDACTNLFTLKQKERMRTVMENSPRRSSLLTSDVCGTQVTAPPVANFRVDRQLVLRGGKVQFTDLSSNFPTQWKWVFEGGDPAVSSEKNPQVQFNEPGIKTVKLVATNSLGPSDSLIRKGYITVSEERVCGSLSNFGKGTLTLLKTPETGLSKGYVAGHNNLLHKAKSEYFENRLGYSNMSGVSIRFGAAYASREDAVVTILVWNARGFQGAPGAVLERKVVLVKVIAEDVANKRATTLSFDRNVPLNGLGFHVGVELTYEGDTVALFTTKNGEATSPTAWQQDVSGNWSPYTTANGLNVAHAIFPVVGMKFSVQTYASALYVSPGETVTLNARGGSLFSWESSGDKLSTTLGPQITVNPSQTTTYTVTGAGDDLCQTQTAVTVYVLRPTGIEPAATLEQVTIFPNPGDGKVTFEMANDATGEVEIALFNSIGTKLFSAKDKKTVYSYKTGVDVSFLSPGVYVARIKVGQRTARRKLVVVK